MLANSLLGRRGEGEGETQEAPELATDAPTCAALAPLFTQLSSYI